MPTPKSRVKRLIQNMLTVSGLVITLFSPVLHAAEFDHRYTNFDQLLTQVVQTLSLIHI